MYYEGHLASQSDDDKNADTRKRAEMAQHGSLSNYLAAIAKRATRRKATQ